MATPTETPPDRFGHLTGAPPITAPEAAHLARRALLEAEDVAVMLSPQDRTEQLIEIAREWRTLALALAQHQAMTPRPKDDDR